MNKDEAILTYIKAKEKYNQAEDDLKDAFSDYQTFFKDGDFEGAREYLRAMPECASKVLCFRHIILAEKMSKG